MKVTVLLDTPMLIILKINLHKNLGTSGRINSRVLYIFLRTTNDTISRNKRKKLSLLIRLHIIFNDRPCKDPRGIFSTP